MVAARASRLLPALVGALLVVQAIVVIPAATGGPQTGAAATAADPTGSGLELSGGVTKAEVGAPSKLTAHVGVGDADVDARLPVPGSPATSPPATCGPGDRPETGLQGDVPLADQLSGRAAEGYSCGLQVVGYDPLGGRASNANMAWAGHCAYVAGEGIAVIDVSDPTSPRQVSTLTTAGSIDAFESITALEYGGRALLAAGRYGLFVDLQLASNVPVDIYDVSDCAHPRLLSTFEFPSSVHNLTFSPDLTRLWSTLPLQAADVADPTRPVYLGNLEAELRNGGVFHLEYAHEVAVSPEGSRLYIGGQVPVDEGSMTVDVTGWPARPATVVSAYAGPGHGISRATIGGRSYLVRSEESVAFNALATGCLPELLTPVAGPAHAFLTDITDEAHPVDAGAMQLEINRPEHCIDQLLSGVNASSHYHDVDDPADTTFVMVSTWNAGLRLWDVRDPAAPREVAYLNPGLFASTLFNTSTTPLDAALNFSGARTGLDQAWGHVRYVKDTGQIWMSTRLGGFWVLELEPQLRAALDLPALPGHAPLSGSPRPPASRALVPPSVLPAGLYCTIGSTRALGTLPLR